MSDLGRQQRREREKCIHKEAARQKDVNKENGKQRDRRGHGEKREGRRREKKQSRDEERGGERRRGGWEVSESWLQFCCCPMQEYRMFKRQQQRDIWEEICRLKIRY